jgi:tetratricopeptide (TPR) repeat protein
VSGTSAPRNGECLTDDVLTDYLEGTLDPVLKSACEAHLIACDPCRENLALFMKVLRDETSPEEEAALQELTAMLDPQKLRPAPPPKRWAVSRSQLLMAGGAVAAFLLLGVFFLRPHSSPALSRQEQIAQTLVANLRPFEPRIVGQPYLQIQETTRSAENLVPDVLTSEMTEDSAASYEVGRFYLLKKDYPTAIRHLKRAIAASKGVPADVHNDLGVAYLESGGTENFASAEIEFKEALRMYPTHAPAVFNLSILYQREGRLDEARRRNQQYQELDPESGWAKELQKKFTGKDSAEQ